MQFCQAILSKFSLKYFLQNFCRANGKIFIAYARQDSLRRRNTKKDSTISVLSFVLAPPGKRAGGKRLWWLSSPRTPVCYGKTIILFPFCCSVALINKKHIYTTGFYQTEKHEKRQYNFCTVFFRGSPGKIRTCDTSVNSRVLLPLSYWGIKNVATSLSPNPFPDQYFRLYRA